MQAGGPSGPPASFPGPSRCLLPHFRAVMTRHRALSPLAAAVVRALRLRRRRRIRRRARSRERRPPGQARRRRRRRPTECALCERPRPMQTHEHRRATAARTAGAELGQATRRAIRSRPARAAAGHRRGRHQRNRARDAARSASLDKLGAEPLGQGRPGPGGTTCYEFRVQAHEEDGRRSRSTSAFAPSSASRRASCVAALSCTSRRPPSNGAASPLPHFGHGRARSRHR